MWRIANWERYYENNRTRGIRVMAWVPVPNKMDGDGFTELMEHPDGAAHYGVWITCLHVASKSHPRGTLLRSNGAFHDLGSLSRITRIPTSIFEVAIKRLVAIGWIEQGVVDEDDVSGEVVWVSGASALACGGDAPSCREGADRVPRLDNAVVLFSSLQEGRLEVNTEDSKSTSNFTSNDFANLKRRSRGVRVAYPKSFEDFWLAISPHKRKEKGEAWKRYQEALRLLSAEKEDPAQFLLDRAKAYYASPLGQSPYCHGPVPFLNKGCYDDDPESWLRKGDSNGNGNGKVQERIPGSRVAAKPSGENVIYNPETGELVTPLE